MKNLQKKINIQIRDTSLISLRKHTIRWENDRYVLCCPQTQFCVFLTPKWKMLIELLDGHKRLHDVKAILLKKTHYFSKSMIDADAYFFVLQLIRWGFVKQIDEVRLEYTHKTESKKDALPWLHAKHVQFLFGKVAKVLTIGTLTLGFAFCVSNPHYLPKTSDFFWSPNFLTSVLTSLVLSWTTLALHELGHFISAKRYGLRASFSLGVRLYFLVAQTTVYSIFMASKKQRLAIYSAGILVDILIMCITWIFLGISDLGFIVLPVFLYALLKQVLILQWFGILWQFFFFMKTDVYFIISDSLGCETLIDNTLAYLRNKAIFFGKHISLFPKKIHHWIAGKKRVKLRYANRMEHEIVPLYAFFVTVGVGLMVLRFFLYYIPINIEIFSKGIFTTLDGLQSLNTATLAQGLAVLALQIFNIGAMIVLNANRAKVPEQ